MGLRRSTQPGHIARAALESIAFQVADALRGDAAGFRGRDGHEAAALRVDGGAAVNDMMMQFQADMLGVPVMRPQVTETTALGAAYLAGLATGFWSGEAELRAQRQNDVRFEPKRDAGEIAASPGAVERSSGAVAAVERIRAICARRSAWADAICHGSSRDIPLFSSTAGLTL